MEAPTFGYLTVDAADAGKLAEFWAELLGVPITGTWEGFVLLEPQEGAVRLAFQTVPEPKTAKNRMHPDLFTEDLDATVARAEALGATRRAEHHDPGFRWWVMNDPEGNEFCVMTRTAG